LIGLADSGADLWRGVGEAGVVHRMMTRNPARQRSHWASPAGPVR